MASIRNYICCEKCRSGAVEPEGRAAPGLVNLASFNSEAELKTYNKSDSETNSNNSVNMIQDRCQYMEIKIKGRRTPPYFVPAAHVVVNEPKK